MIKRFLDIAFSALGLFLLAPLLLIVMLILRFTGEGEVFFRQERMGFGNRPIHITKFATMVKSAANPARGDYIVGNDPRILPLGRILRKTKINELLQLWDVLRGRMSLVGPRPQMLRVHALYPEEYAHILDRVRPGITGVGSIVFRNEEAILEAAADRDYCYSSQIVPYKARLEAWYMAHHGVGLDLLLLMLTFWQVLRPSSAAIMTFLPGDLMCDIMAFDGKRNPKGAP